MNPNEEKERALWRQQKHLEIKSELKQNEKFQKYLEQTYPFARDRFLDDYAADKVRWLEWGPKNKEWNEREDLQWINDAFERLKEIQQKKLFDAQCLWRAEKIQLDEIKITHDFFDWENNILNCPFIEPVTEQEVEIYMQYLQSFNFESEQGWFDRWQDYRAIKEAYDSDNENRNFPEWYDFHNGRTGLGVYMLLPDIRGKKEDFYFGLWGQEVRQKQEEEKKKQQAEQAATASGQRTSTASPAIDKRPHLNHWNKGWLTWFINTFEDKATQEAFVRCGGEGDSDDRDELLDNDLEIIGRACCLVPIEAHYDWREAVRKAADKYRREKIAESLPLAYERYRMNIDLNISFEQQDHPAKEFKDTFRNAILRGRELNGEPRDFDF